MASNAHLLRGGSDEVSTNASSDISLAPLSNAAPPASAAGEDTAGPAPFAAAGGPVGPTLAELIESDRMEEAAEWFLEAVRRAAAAASEDDLKAAAIPADWEAQIAGLSSLQRIDLVRELGPERLPAAALMFVRPSELGLLMSEWPPELSVPLISQLPPSERSELLQQLPLLTIQALSPLLSAEDLELVKYSQSFPAHSVGRIMRPLSTTVLCLPAATPLDEAVQAYAALVNVSSKPPLGIIATNSSQNVVGVVTAPQLVAHLAGTAAAAAVGNAAAGDGEGDGKKRSKKKKVKQSAGAAAVDRPLLASVCEQPKLVLMCDMLQDDMRATVRGLAGHLYSGDILPVVDPEDHILLGVVTLLECLDAAEDAVTRAYGPLTSADSDGVNFVKSTRLRMIFRRTLWLTLLILMNMGASFVIGAFDSVLEHNVALASFIPMLVGMGGNAGSQAVALIISALASRSLTVRDYGRAVVKEAPVAIVLSAIISVLGWIIAYARAQDVGVSFTVAIAMFIVMTLADLLGLLLPFVAVGLRVDPELMSNPILTTVVDIAGLAIYFGVALGILHV